MQRRLLFPFLALAALAAVLGGVDRASAAIRITISDGTTEKVFYSTSSRTALFSTDIGAYDVLLQTTLSNFPGDATGGSLTQAISLSDDADVSGSVLPTLTITSAVVNNISGLSTGFVTDAGQLDAVRNATLSFFTSPSGSSLTGSSDIHGEVPFGQPAGGNVQLITEVNGTAIPSLIVEIDSEVDADVDATVANTPSGYTLTSQVIFSDGPPGVSGLTIGSVSGVTASGPEPGPIVPEPASMVVWSLGALGIAIAGAARYRRRSNSRPVGNA
jgi:hypothetical protein